MPSKTVIFQSSEWLPNLGGGNRILFKYSIVDTAFVNQVDEASHININDVTVKITYSQEVMWNLEKAKLEKVLFEYAKRHLAFKVEQNSLTQHEHIDLQTFTTPKICPYDPNKITISFGKPFKFPVKRSFGFQTGRS